MPKIRVEYAVPVSGLCMECARCKWDDLLSEYYCSVFPEHWYIHIETTRCPACIAAEVKE